MARVLLFLSILADVFGIVGFIYILVKGLLRERRKTFYALCFLIAILTTIIIKNFSVVWPLEVQHPVRFSKITFTLTIEDSSGAVVQLTKHQIIVALIDGYEFHWDRNLRSTGYLQDFHSSYGLVAEVCTIAASIEVVTKFPCPLEKGTEYHRTFSLTAIDSYLEPEEDILYQVDYPTDDATVRIIFPPERPFKEILSCLKRLGSTQIVINKGSKEYPKFSNRYEIEWTIGRPTMGWSYYLKWRW